MKKLLLATLVLGWIFGFHPQPVEAQKNSDLSLVFMTAGMVDDEFENLTGGLVFGAIKSIDSDRDLYVRLAYSQFNLTPGEAKMRSIKPSLMWKLMIGKSWHLWLVPAGADIYLTGENRDVDMFLGFGGQRRLWTMEGGSGFNFFGECSFTDADAQKFGNFVQLNLGFIYDWTKK